MHTVNNGEKKEQRKLNKAAEIRDRTVEIFSDNWTGARRIALCGTLVIVRNKVVQFS